MKLVATIAAVLSSAVLAAALEAGGAERDVPDARPSPAIDPADDRGWLRRVRRGDNADEHPAGEGGIVDGGGVLAAILHYISDAAEAKEDDASARSLQNCIPDGKYCGRGYSGKYCCDGVSLGRQPCGADREGQMCALPISSNPPVTPTDSPPVCGVGHQFGTCHPGWECMPCRLGMACEIGEPVCCNALDYCCEMGGVESCDV